MAPNHPPPASALVAFGLIEAPVPLPGGRGQTWANAGVVLKPIDDEAEVNWIANLAANVEQDGFRVARPIATLDGRWIIDGWSAWTRVKGEHSTTRWHELLAAATAFHAAVADVPKPEFIERRQDRWRTADRVAWGEIQIEGLDSVAHVGRLIAARRPLVLPSQLVHGDLVGNVLFADGMPPAILDLSLYWRPVGYSAALVIGDAIAWEGARQPIVSHIEHFSEWQQLLLRAVIFRIVVSHLARRAMPSRKDLSEHYRPVVDLAVSLATG